MRFPLVASALVLAACAAPAPVGPPPSLTAPAPSPSAVPVRATAPSLEDTIKALQAAAAASGRAEETARSLATEVGARISGGPKDAAAVAWAKRAFEAQGFARVHTEIVKVPHWERGVGTVQIVGAGAQKLNGLALGGSVATPEKGLEADVVEVASLAELTSATEAALKGKIVFVNAPMRRSQNGSGYGEAVGTRAQSPKVAGDKGALAVVLRSVGTDDLVPHTGATSRQAKIPGVALSGQSADALHEVLATKKRARIKLVVGAKWLEPVDSANVVGDIVGAEHPDEIVLMGAHLDSWDVGQGAVDDAAGCAIVLEAGRLIGALGRPPKRTVRVVLFAAEEMSVAGGDAYAQAHDAELGKHVVAMEADSGTAKVYGVRLFGGPAALPSFEAVAKLLSPLGVEAEKERARGGTDIRAMMGKGVPAIDLEQDFSKYFDVHHTDSDTVERLDPEGLRQSAAAYATAAWAVADSNADLGRAPPREEKK